jgi:hypothetical protein
MRLKKYLEFIKESIDIDDIFEFKEKDFVEYFLELKDAGWLIRVDSGSVKKVKVWSYVENKYNEEEEFTELLIPGEEVENSYLIYIFRGSRVNNEDVTDNLLFGYDIIKDITGAREIKVLDDTNSPLDINDVLIKGGIFIGKDLDIEDQIEIDNISFFIKTGKKVKLKENEIAEYYGWSYDKVDKMGNIYTHIELEDIADWMLDKNSEYKDMLIKGMEHMWDYYEHSNYIPDIQSFFQYTLNKENEVLLIKSMIKESGGLEEFINHIGDECSDEAYDSVKEKSEEEVINYLLKERFYSSIKELSSNSEIYSDISSLVADWEMSAHVDDNYDAILSEFDNIVGKEFEYKRIKKEVTKKFKTKDSEGNVIFKEYQSEEIFYEIPFDNKWLLEHKDYDANDLNNFKDIYDILREYFYDASFDYILNPRINDWGDVDNKALNSEISAILNRYLKK